ncbi:hypothetical protein F4680DRAFT_451410 [Xylaria scruposa]|nr:hypothetical protein F4680DRAFT_451410 [Xylaria scruposa]
MSCPATPTTQADQTVSDTQAAPVAQASRTTYGNPFTWKLPEGMKESIEEIVYSELFAGTRVKREDMGSMISYRIAPVSFDVNLKPHSVHPAFWNFDTYRAPKIGIKRAPGSHKIWKNCYNALYEEVLRKYDVKNCIVAFQDGNHNEEIYGPRYFQMGEMAVKNNDDIEIITYELLSAKLPMLRDDAPYARDGEEKSWFEYALGEKCSIAEIVRNVFYAETNFTLSDVMETITFTSTFITLDDNLEPVTVFQGFWYPGMITTPYVTIPVPTQDTTRWEYCIHQLRSQHLEEFTFKLYHQPSRIGAIFPPTHIWLHGTIRTFKSYTLLKWIIQCRLMDVQNDLNSVTEAEIQANSIKWSFSTWAMNALEYALVEIERQNLLGVLEV